MKYPLTSISNVANFINGFPFKPTDWGANGFQIIRIQNLSNQAKPYNRTLKEVPSQYIVRKGDILVSWSATIDVFEWDDEDSYLNQHIFKVEYNSNKINKQYFKLSLKNTIRELDKFAHGSTMKHVVKGDFENHQIPLPPLDDQIRIATVLTRAEKLIAKRKESIKALDEFLKSTFLEMFGDPVRNEKGWGLVSLKEMCHQVIDCPHNTPKYVDEHTGLYCIRSADIQNGYLDFSNTLQVDIGTFRQRNIRHVPFYNDIVFTREGGRLGNSARVPQNPMICLGQRVMLFTVDNKIATSEFLWAVLNPVTFQKCINNLVGGGAAPRVNIKDLIKIECYLPPLGLQNQFALIVTKIESLKSKYSQSLTELENLYGSLSQRAFKGELDLSKVLVDNNVFQ